jgi:hypothetical protein
MERGLARICFVCILWGSQNRSELRNVFTSGLVCRLPSRVYCILRVWYFISYYLNARFVFREKLRLSKAMQYPLVYRAVFNWTRIVIRAD